MPVQPTVGMVVNYYTTNRANQGGNQMGPYAAIVTKTYPDGSVDLRVFPDASVAGGSFSVGKVQPRWTAPAAVDTWLPQGG